jgi:membrane protein DedA with SNARE-associated domain
MAVADSHVATSVLRWLRHLGGPGLILLGLVDNSVVPAPGSMDLAMVVLSAGQRKLWLYYALMATIGAMAGGYLTYRLARREGGGRLVRRLNRSKMAKVHATIEKWGFGAIAVSALLPPPFPMVPFLVAAGATQYSQGKFLAALFAGRGIRYSVLGFFAARYGSGIWNLLSQHEQAALWAAIGLMTVAVAIALLRARFKPRSAGAEHDSGAHR